MALQNCVYFALQKLFDRTKSAKTAFEEAKETALQAFEEQTINLGLQDMKMACLDSINTSMNQLKFVADGNVSENVINHDLRYKYLSEVFSERKLEYD